jgi:iduronate 2-sulfatase
MRKAVSFILMVMALTACDSKEKGKTKPNILFVSIDDLKPTIGVYGDQYAVTPNLDAFAKTGLTFMRAYSQAGVCAPSRASLMTGLRPDSTRVWHLGDKFRELMPEVVTMPQYFHNNGYQTVNLGKIFHNYMPDSISWDEPDLRPPAFSSPDMYFRDGETFYLDEETNRRQKIARDSLIKLRPVRYADGWNTGPVWEWKDVHDSLYYDGAQTELAKRTLTRIAQNDKPFYMGLGYFRPHMPFTVPKKYWDMYDPNELPLADNPYHPKGAPVWTMNSNYELRHYDGFNHIGKPIDGYRMEEDTARMLKHGYYASVSYVDAQFGKLIQHLKDIDIYDNTIIIVWGDHGWKLGEHNSWSKQTNYHIDTHVPMMIHVPGQKNQGAKSEALTELIDMYPTLLELAGIEVPDYLQGSSFVPLLNEPNKEWKTAAFSQFHRRPQHTPDNRRYMGYSMKTETHHYIEWYDWDNVKGLKGEFRAAELYDLVNDPDENINIAEASNTKLLVAEFSKQLKAGWKAARPN